MSELNQIIDDGNPGKYFTQILNMAEDELGPYEYRLLAHYKRWASTGPTIEGLRKTAKLCKMSPQRVSDAREKLIEAGYIRYQPPTEAQKAKGIAGIVRVIDRMEENIKRYTPKNLPVQNSIQVDSDSSVQKSVHSPVQKIAQYEEPKKEELKDSAANNATGSAGDKPLSPRPNKPKSSKADPWYDNILAVWKLHAGGNGDMRKFLQGTATKKGWKEYNPPPGYTLTDATEICHFAAWYRNTHQSGKRDLSMVAERGKLQSAIIEWVDAGRPTGDAGQYRNERLFT